MFLDKFTNFLKPNTAEDSNLTKEQKETFYRLLHLQITPQTGFKTMSRHHSELIDFIYNNINILTKSQYQTLQNKADEMLDEIERIKNQMRNHPYNGNAIPRESGTPNVYNHAIRQWNFFADYYNNFCTKEGWAYDVPALDVILDIAPKINDKATMDRVLSDLNTMTLNRYNVEKIKLIFSTGDIIETFRKAHISDVPVKQVDLVKPFEAVMPSLDIVYRDVKWCIYVWKQFDIVQVEKKGRYNFITLKKWSHNRR